MIPFPREGRRPWLGCNDDWNRRSHFPADRVVKDIAIRRPIHVLDTYLELIAVGHLHRTGEGHSHEVLGVPL